MTPYSNEAAPTAASADLHPDETLAGPADSETRRCPDCGARCPTPAHLRHHQAFRCCGVWMHWREVLDLAA
jgi:hypothetical protein